MGELLLLEYLNCICKLIYTSASDCLLVFCAGGPVAAARVLVLFAGALRAAVDSTIILDRVFFTLGGATARAAGTLGAGATTGPFDLCLPVGLLNAGAAVFTGTVSILSIALFAYSYPYWHPWIWTIV